MTRTRDTAEVVIIGGGFAGIYAAQALSKAPVRVTILDRRNHHLFQPLLYQVATAGLNPSDIACPIRRVVRGQKNARVLLADVTRVDTEAKTVEFDGGSIQYDYLIVATGATHSYFGHPEWEALAPGLKTIEDALEIRARVFLAFEEAERTLDRTQQGECLTFVVVGGGPTGVELAGTLAEIARHSMKRDFRAIEPEMASVILIEGLDRVLPSYPESLSLAARRQLEKLGVLVRTGCMVTAIDAHGVTLQDGERIPSRTVLWAAGVAASPLARTLDVPLDRAGRILVQPDLTLPGRPEVFVAGDLAALSCDGMPVPGVAPAAIQEGKHAAGNIRRAIAGQPLAAFRYRDKGSLATIGRAAAVANFKRFKLTGFLAWWAWWAIHIFFLIGFRSRLLVMFGWAWSYFTFQRGARLITGGAAHARAQPADQRDTTSRPRSVSR